MNRESALSTGESLELLERVGYIARTLIPTSAAVQFLVPGTPRIALYYPSSDTFRTYEHGGREFSCTAASLLLYLVVGIAPQVGVRWG